MARSDRTLLHLDTLAFRRAMHELAKEDPERASRLRAERTRQRNVRYESALDAEGHERLKAAKRDWWARAALVRVRPELVVSG
jgi:hypothetical protein